MLQGTLDEVSNRATFDPKFKFLDTDTGEPIDLTGVTLVYEMCPRNDPLGPSLVASSIPGQAGDIFVIDLGVAQVIFPVSAMRVCAPVVYNVGMTAKTDDTDVCPVFVGGISIIDGVVRSP